MKPAIQTAIFTAALLLASLPKPVAAAPGNHSLFIAGSAFTPRKSSQTVTYEGNGCSYSNEALTTSVNLPAGSSVTGVRAYYYNPGLGNIVRILLTSYDGLGASSDLIGANTSLSSGYENEYFSASSPIVIDNFNHSYVLTAVTTVSGLRLCGVRVLYNLP